MDEVHLSAVRSAAQWTFYLLLGPRWRWSHDSQLPTGLVELLGVSDFERARNGRLLLPCALLDWLVPHYAIQRQRAAFGSIPDWWTDWQYGCVRHPVLLEWTCPLSIPRGRWSLRSQKGTQTATLSSRG